MRGSNWWDFKTHGMRNLGSFLFNTLRPKGTFLTFHDIFPKKPVFSTKKAFIWIIQRRLLEDPFRCSIDTQLAPFFWNSRVFCTPWYHTSCKVVKLSWHQFWHHRFYKSDTQLDYLMTFVWKPPLRFLLFAPFVSLPSRFAPFVSSTVSNWDDESTKVSWNI